MAVKGNARRGRQIAGAHLGALGSGRVLLQERIEKGGNEQIRKQVESCGEKSDT